MGTFGSIFELLRDTSFQIIEEEANREVAIALAGSNQETRDRLYKALSRPMESLWASNPFRMVEYEEQPQANGENGGLLVYALNEHERIEEKRQDWLRSASSAANVTVILVVLPGQKEAGQSTSNLGARLQALNPLRLVVGNSENANFPSGVGADGASLEASTANKNSSTASEVELEELKRSSGGKLEVVYLSDLGLIRLEKELLPLIVKGLVGKELALARRAPIFRNAVADHFIFKTARSNAETVLLANVTSGIPFISGFFGGGADFVLLTKNQFELSHRLANIYGQKRNGWVELYLELVPIMVAALVWRSLARSATAKIHVFLAIVPKAALAFSATFIIGRIARIYYSSGRKGPEKVTAFLRGLFEQITGQSRNNQQGFEENSPRRLKSS